MKFSNLSMDWKASAGMVLIKIVVHASLQAMCQWDFITYKPTSEGLCVTLSRIDFSVRGEAVLINNNGDEFLIQLPGGPPTRQPSQPERNRARIGIDSFGRVGQRRIRRATHRYLVGCADFAG